jgi:hypothetical protein
MQLVVIAGFHRSGTSMVTRMFHLSGLFVGNKLLGSSPSNPYGHFEDEQIIKIHDDILAENGLDWMVKENIAIRISEPNLFRMVHLIRSRNVNHQVWGFKDPRVCLFCDTWRKLVPNAIFVLVFRDFLETTNSFLKRHSRDILMVKGNADKHIKFWNEIEYAYRMWLVHNKRLVNLVRSEPENVIAVTHDQILKGLNLIDIVNNKFNLGLNKIDIKSTIDFNVMTQNVRNLPQPSPDLLLEMFELWRDIQEITGDFECNIEKKFELSTQKDLSGKIQQLNSIRLEFNNLSSLFGENKKLLENVKALQ